MSSETGTWFMRMAWRCGCRRHVGHPEERDRCDDCGYARPPWPKLVCTAVPSVRLAAMEAVIAAARLGHGTEQALIALDREMGR